jgi:hypothetical protein
MNKMVDKIIAVACVALIVWFYYKNCRKCHKSQVVSSRRLGADSPIEMEITFSGVPVGYYQCTVDRQPNRIDISGVDNRGGTLEMSVTPGSVTATFTKYDGSGPHLMKIPPSKYIAKENILRTDIPDHSVRFSVDRSYSNFWAL